GCAARHGPAGVTQLRPRRGRDPGREPARAGRWCDGSGARALGHGGRGRPRVPDGDGGGTSLHAGPGRDRVATRRRAALPRSPPLRDHRADARGGAALLRSRAVRQGHAGPEPDPMRFPLLVVGLLVLVLTEATSAQTGNVSRYTLPNGLRLLVREDSSAGVVAVSLQSRAGS